MTTPSCATPEDRFTLPVPFRSGEGALGLALRSAALHRSPVLRQFVGEHRLSRHGLVTGSVIEVERLGTLAGFDADQRAELREWSGIGEGEGRFGAARPRKGFVRGLLPPVCANCLRKDMETNDGLPLSRPYVRGMWFLHMVRSCPHHGVLLVHPRAAGPARDAWKSDPANYARVEGEGASLEPDALRYASILHGKLHGRTVDTGDTVLDDLPPDAFDRLCMIVGGQIVSGSSRVSAKGITLAMGSERTAVGYAALLSDGFEGHLDRLTRGADIGSPRSEGCWGSLREWLASDPPPDGTTALREIAAERFETTRSYTAGHTFLGRRLQPSRHVRISEVAKVFGVSKFVMSAEILDLRERDPSSDWIERHSIPISRIPEIEMVRGTERASDVMRRLDISKKVLSTLVDGGVITPVIRRSSSRVVIERYRTADVDALLDSLPEKTLSEESADGGLDLWKARARTGRPISELLSDVISGKLHGARCVPEENGLRAIRIPARSLAPRQSGNSLTRRSLARAMGIAEQTASAIVACGLVDLDDHEAVRTFARDHATLKQLSRRTGRFSPRARDLLDANGIEPVGDPKKCRGRIYRIDQALALLERRDR